MKSNNTTVKLLGAAFLFQALASAIGMLVLKDPLIVTGDIIATMTNISNHSVQMGLSNVFIPSLPFELGIGFWLLIKGIKVE